MVGLTGTLDRSRVLDALDETPQTTERLARRLDVEPARVAEVLEHAEEDKLVVDWGDVWATTWRAKLELSRGFFRVWIPASLALGAGLTATAAWLNAPRDVGSSLTWGMTALALAAGAVTLVPLVLGSGSSRRG